MYRLPTQLIGKISLLLENGRKTPMGKELWGNANLIGSKEQNSYVVYLTSQDELNPGESCEAEFSFKFHDHEKFQMKVHEGLIIELNQGSQKIGEFLIDKVLSPKLMKK